MDRKVSASTQSQALQALLFLYRVVLEVELPWLENVIRANRPRRLPVVLSRADVCALPGHLQGRPWLVANLLYGGGLRLLEALRLRVKDLLVERHEIIIRDAKGGKDRVTVLPETLDPALRTHMRQLRDWFEAARRRGAPGVSLPQALTRKYAGAATLLRHPPAGRWLRHPHGAGAARPRRREEPAGSRWLLTAADADLGQALERA